MDITFIGCGDSFSDVLGNNSALLTFENTNLLIDIPDSNYSRIKHLGMDYSDIENIFITHLHGDHINGLERLAYYRQYATPVLRPNEEIHKPNLFVPETLYFGLWDSVKNGLGITADGIKTLENYFNVYVIQLQNGYGAFEINGVLFSLVQSEHVPNMPVYGLHVENEFFYSADSTFDGDKVHYFLEHSKKVFHDIHFFGKPLAVHASIEDFIIFSPEDKKKIFAMHYDDSKSDNNEIDGITLVKPYVPVTI